MKIDILTLFPNMFDGFLNESIIKRALQNKKVSINIIDFRTYSNPPHYKVDDYQYGGGKGMVLMIEPIYKCLEEIRKENTKVILMTPQGTPYKQKIAYQLKEEKHIVLICGHYEGFDERIRSLVDMEVSIGDFVLTGGELPSMVITDSIVRLIDTVIQEESHINDSFNDNLLDYPVYTRPVEFNGMKVPDVLLSGHHKNIENWKKEQALLKTQEKRPDLLEKS